VAGDGFSRLDIIIQLKSMFLIFLAIETQLYATKLRELGLLQEQVDLCQGRLEKSVFLQHYFKQNPKALSDKILELLPKLETLIS